MLFLSAIVYYRKVEKVQFITVLKTFAN